MSFREEFRLRKFWCNDVRTERFCLFQWRCPGLVYLLYRLALAAYTLAWLIITAAKAEKSKAVPQEWGAYLTNWTYTLLTIYFLLHALIAVVVYTICRGAGLKLMNGLTPEQHRYLFHELGNSYEQIPEEGTSEVAFSQNDRLPWYFILLWMVFNAVSVGAVMVTIVFWAILVPTSDLSAGDVDNIQLHLVNTVLILIEHSVTALPVRLLHVIYPIIYGFIYMFFSLFYWVDDHDHVMYPILDWGKAGETFGYIILIGFVIMPIIHLAMYGLYRLRLLIYKKICQH